MQVESFRASLGVLRTTAVQLQATKHGGYILPLRIVNAVPEAHVKAKRGVPPSGPEHGLLEAG
jgi:hypothetical protein